ncbi:MAG: hypothetical protein MJZ19_00880 [Paludibacteraceae bacterium]|nr:hypothetical protein [Paludibacteraceae bacterium]
MIIRKVTQEDLPMIAKLSKDKSLKDRADICLEYSRICLDEDNTILAFALVKESLLDDYFNGEIPVDDSEDLNDEDYEEGDELWLVEHLIYFKDRQYEVISSYLKKNYNSDILYKVLSELEVNKSGCPIGLIWSKKDINSTFFYNFNNYVWVSVPFVD